MKEVCRVTPLPHNRPLSWRHQSVKPDAPSESSKVPCKFPFGDNTPLSTWVVIMAHDSFTSWLRCMARSHTLGPGTKLLPKDTLDGSKYNTLLSSRSYSILMHLWNLATVLGGDVTGCSQVHRDRHGASWAQHKWGTQENHTSPAQQLCFFGFQRMHTKALIFSVVSW